MQVQSLVTHCFVRKYKDAYFCKLAVNKKFFVKYGNDNTEEMHVITDPIGLHCTNSFNRDTELKTRTWKGNKNKIRAAIKRKKKESQERVPESSCFRLCSRLRTRKRGLACKRGCLGCSRRIPYLFPQFK